MSAEPELVRRCLRGETAATFELVKRFELDVFAFCLRLMRHRHDAEDVAQDVFVRVFRSLGRWDAARPLKPWILGIAVNRCRTAMAKRAKRPDAVDYLADLPDRTPEVESQELAEAIAEGVANLRPEYREVFVLYHESQLSYDEIGAAVDRPVGTVKTWIHRARGILAEFLKERGLLDPEPELTEAK